ncbi:hypothetical protein FQN57_003953 [Myotisia sp. PD_48]|nr:hypothetical protein FQN57_003953 [Myotisia sp. PD_48]
MPSFRSLVSSFKSNESNITLPDSLNIRLSQPYKSRQTSLLPGKLDPQKLHFFDLPLRVRREIYRHAVAPGKVFIRPFVSLHYLNDRCKLEDHSSPNMVLFQTCKRIHAEACQVFYQDNIFSIVHPDFLLDTIDKYPRLKENIKQMHRIELMFDHQDFRYLRDTFCNELLKAGIVKSRHSQKFKGPKKLAKKLFKFRSMIFGYKTYLGGKRKKVPRPKRVIDLHSQSLKSMHDYLFGRTLTFLRQRFLITKLEVNLSGCICVGGCCRLVNQILTWGIRKIWTFGLPRTIAITGATEGERKKILKVLARQKPTRAMLGQLRKMNRAQRKSFTNRSFRGLFNGHRGKAVARRFPMV